MIYTGSVEADAVRRGQSVHAAKGRQIVGDTHAECCQGNYVATVGCELGHLCTGDQITDLICFGLNLQSIGLDGDSLTLASDREADILFQGLSRVHDDVCLGVCLKSLPHNIQSEMSDAHVREEIDPCAVCRCLSFLPG